MCEKKGSIWLKNHIVNLFSRRIIMCKKLIYLILFISVLVLSGGAYAQDPNLIGWWKLDETSGSIAADSSGYGNDGALVGDPQWISGYIDGALDLDGDGDYVDCGYDPIFDVSDELTVATWLTVRSIPTQWVSVVAKGEFSWRISNNDSAPSFHFGITLWSEPSPSINGNTTVGLEEWHHVAGTYDGADISLYLDGELDGTVSTTSSIGVNTANVYIGENPEAAGRHWDGFIDDVRIYNRALSQAEIAALIQPQLKATLPYPDDKSIFSTTEFTLLWAPGHTADQQHLFIGESLEDVRDGTGGTDQGLLDQPRHDGYPWEIGKTYYWRVEQVMADGTSIHPGDVWSFTILPLTASKPVPEDGAEYINTDTSLEWTGGAGSVRHNVYIGDNLQDVEAGAASTNKGAVQEATYTPDSLDYNQTYYWRIDEFDGTDTHTGEVWSFTTVGPDNGAKGQYFNNVNLTGEPVLTRIDPRIDFSWDEDSPAPSVNTDFSARWTAELEVPLTETYTFYTLTDNCARLWVDGQLIIDNWDVDNAWAIEDLGVIDLEAGWVSLKMEFYDDGGEATAQLSWQSPSVPRQVISPAALSLPVRATDPEPANGAADTENVLTLQWSEGDSAAQHDIYFGTDYNDVAQADATMPDIYRGRQELENTSYIPSESPLEWNTTYYWRVDEVNDAEPTSPWRGDIWSFTTGNYYVLDDFEDYNDYEPDRIFETWLDGYNTTTNGSTAGYPDPDFNAGEHFVETEVVHGGVQSMPYFYDNDMKYSEAERVLDSLRDWTQEGVNELSLWFRGHLGYVGSFVEEPAGTYTMTGSGTDIWEEADEFHFAYKQFTGAGSIMVRVRSVEDTDSWAKAGVMIRNTLEPGSRHAMVVVTPGEGVSFQRRLLTDSASAETTEVDITAPLWVKIERDISGNFTGSYSTNGVSWTQIGVDTVNMNATAYVGLVVTAHDATTACEAVFSNVIIDGTVSGEWANQDIGVISNSPQQMYVAVSNSTGDPAVVYHEDLGVTVIYDWTEWVIPLQEFADQGIDLTDVDRIAIGIGTKGDTTSLGGTGKMFFDDIRLYLPLEP
jgi:hypothetical protein